VLHLVNLLVILCLSLNPFLSVLVSTFYLLYVIIIYFLTYYALFHNILHIDLNHAKRSVVCQIVQIL
jgi:hypothetical protein